MKRLYRDRSDVKIAGVCSGIANYLNVDPTAIRLAFVLLFFIGGGGLWIYLVLWIIMPYDPNQEPSAIEVEPKKEPAEPKKIAQPRKVAEKRPAPQKSPAKKSAGKKHVVKNPEETKTVVKKTASKSKSSGK